MEGQLWGVQYVWCVSVTWWWNFSTLVSCVNGMNVLPFLLLPDLGCSWPYGFILERERHTAFQWLYLPQASHLVPYAGHKDLRVRSWRFPQFPHLSPLACLSLDFLKVRFLWETSGAENRLSSLVILIGPRFSHIEEQNRSCIHWWSALCGEIVFYPFHLYIVRKLSVTYYFSFSFFSSV